MTGIEIRDVTKLHAGDGGKCEPVFERFALRVAAAEIVGLLGPNGCGKTTLLDMIAGINRPDAGEVVIHGGRKA